MAGFNRNVITRDDAAAFNAGTPPRTLDTTPPAVTGAGSKADADDYLTRLLKYVPLEIIGAYVLISGLITSNVTDPDILRWWLLGLLVALVALTAPYARVVLRVVRVSQLAMGALGFVTYAFATGGWFATFEWYEAWQGTIALVVFSLLVSLVRLPQLPEAKP